MKTDYRQNTWNLQEARSTFLRQMADHARGEKIRQLRTQRGLSQEEVARALNVTAKTYGDWERGGGIRGPNARKLARYFRVKPGELIDPEIPVASPNGDSPLHAPELQEQLDEINRKLDELLRRTAPSEPAQPETEPAADDEIPTDLPDGPDSEPESPGEDEDDSEAAG